MRHANFFFRYSYHPNGNSYVVDITKRSYPDDGDSNPGRNVTYPKYDDCEVDDIIRTRLNQSRMIEVIEQMIDVLPPEIVKRILMNKFGDKARTDGIRVEFREEVVVEGGHVYIRKRKDDE